MWLVTIFLFYKPPEQHNPNGLEEHEPCPGGRRVLGKTSPRPAGPGEHGSGEHGKGKKHGKEKHDKGNHG